ncbi:hypothetical protein BC567DRAFT_213671 [Phyllosticta citribraziliensis]
MRFTTRTKPDSTISGRPMPSPPPTADDEAPPPSPSPPSPPPEQDEWWFRRSQFNSPHASPSPDLPSSITRVATKTKHDSTLSGRSMPTPPPTADDEAPPPEQDAWWNRAALVWQRLKLNLENKYQHIKIMTAAFAGSVWQGLNPMLKKLITMMVLLTAALFIMGMLVQGSQGTAGLASTEQAKSFM